MEYITTLGFIVMILGCFFVAIGAVIIRPIFGELWGMVFSSVALVIAVVFPVYQVFTGSHNDLEKRVSEWKQFSTEHDCKVVEKNIDTGFLSKPQNGWLCNDGVKYYHSNNFGK